MTVILFIVAIASIILIHELGHFLAAKLVGIPIQEFGIGFPPRILTLFRSGGTEYTLNWILVGGFVRPQETGDENIPDALMAAPPWKRIVVLISGPLFNLGAAIIMLAIVFYQTGSKLEHLTITDVLPGTPAAEALLQVGDYILEVNGTTVDTGDELSAIIDPNKGKEISLTMMRESEVFSVSLTPRTDYPVDEGPMGIGFVEPVTVPQAFLLGVRTIQAQIYYIATAPVRLVGFKGMFTGLEVAVSMDASDQDIPAGANTIWFFASISISLGLINLLPVPVFDGGKILLALPEWLTRRRVPIMVHYVLNAISIAFVLILMIYVNVQDFINPAIIPSTPPPTP